MKLIKRITFFMILITSIFILKTVALADDGTEIKKFYDFEDYSAAIGSGIMPDSNWDYLVTNYLNFGSAQSDEEHGTVLKSNGAGAEPNFYFGQLITSGNLHISYDFKLLSNTTRMLMMFYHGTKWGAAPLPRRTESSTSGYSMAVWVNELPNQMRWFQGAANGNANMTQWERQSVDKDFDFTNEWHRVDMVTYGMSGNSCYADLYIDGVKMNKEPIYFGASGGFHTFGFRNEASTSATTANPSLGSHLDNVYVHRYSGSESLELNIMGSDRVDLENGVLSVHINDFVDESLLNSENIKVMTTEGDTLSNYEIVPKNNGGAFDVVFEGSIEPGRYQIELEDNLTGKIFGTKAEKALEFKTDFKTVPVNASVFEENFNSYVSENEGDLPESFVTDAATTYALPVEGKDGEGDIALGFESDSNQRTVQRYMADFMQPIAEGSEYIIEFDTFVSGNDLRYYIATSKDAASQPDNAILKIDSAGNVFMADKNTANPASKISGVTLTPGEWHHIKLEMRLDASGTKINVTAIFDEDADNAKTFESTYFANCDILGFGFGFVAKKDMDLRIDNISTMTDMLVSCPEVSEMRFYDYAGEQIEMNDVVTAMISYVEIDFNTLVSEDTDALKEVIVFTEDGAPIDYDLEVQESLDKTYSTVILTFPGLLNEVCDYILKVQTGVPAKIENSVKSILADSISFTTDRTLDMTITGVDEAGNVGSSLTFSKNDYSTGDFLYGAANYSYKTCIVDGVEMQVPTMEEIQIKRIVIPESYKGQFTEEMVISGSGEEDFETKYFFWHYPSLQKVVLENDRVQQ